MSSERLIDVALRADLAELILADIIRSIVWSGLGVIDTADPGVRPEAAADFNLCLLADAPILVLSFLALGMLLDDLADDMRDSAVFENKTTSKSLIFHRPVE